MAEKSNLNPQVSEQSDLATLSIQALRRYGDFSPGAVDGELVLMFLEFANLIIDDVRLHPYWPLVDTKGKELPPEPLDYYTHPTEARAIPDPILIAGLLAYYAVQQNSQKSKTYMPMYTRTLNQQLWYRRNGNTKIQMRVVDGGSHPSYIGEAGTDPTNGMTGPADE